MDVYKPKEDSELLINQVNELVNKGVKTLDMGTGSGVIVEALLEKTSEVTGVDVNPYAVKNCREKFPKAKFIQSDLFKNVKGKFDVITFNPPYLPEQKGEDLETALQVSGGLKGYELLLKFLKQAKSHLKKEGFILTVFSSLTKPEEVFNKTKKMGYEHELLDSKKVFFETLYCVKFKLK